MSTIDLSRQVTDFRKQYAGVRMQQGRMLTDDDFNEAALLEAEDHRRTRLHTIGAFGSPDDGFLPKDLTVVSGKPSFTLSAGNLYLGGLRLELNQDQAFHLQKNWLNFDVATDWPAAPASGQTRVDLIWIEAWQQPVTAIEDKELFEVALSGADTSVRQRTMHRVHILTGVSSDECAAAWTFALSSASFTAMGTLASDMELATTAKLSVGFSAPTSMTDLCSPPTAGGYLGAENQAIRVQMVSPTTYTWGYNNASPLYRVQVSSKNAQLVKVKLLTEPKDAVHWPLQNQVVEILPWSAALSNGERIADIAGHLSKVAVSYNPDDKTFEISTPLPANFGTQWKTRSDKSDFYDGTAEQNFFYLRIWDRGADLTSPAAIPIAAKNLGSTGLTISFTGGPLRAGDYWIIAARPAAPDVVVPWEIGSIGGRAPHGIQHYRAPLALIRWKFQSGKLQESEVRDCRPPFVPLTSRWWGGGCSIVVAPVPGWERLLSFFQEGQDVSICFQVGDFKLNRPLEFKKLKSIKMVGAGPGSRIVVSGHETALLFNDCESAIVRDLHIESRPLKSNMQTNEKHLNGAITFMDCTNVQVSDCDLSCPEASGRRQSCVTIRCKESETSDRILIERNRLLVGAWQTGILLVNADHAVIRENHISMAKAQKYPGFSLPGVFVDILESLIMGGFSKVASSATKEIKAKKSNVLINVVAKSLAEPIIRDFAKIAPKNVATAPGGVEEALRRFARGLAAGLRVNLLSKAGRNTLEMVRQSLRACGQGIVVAGTRVGVAQILENIVEDAIQGVHVGLSNPEVAGPESVKQVVLSRNTVHCLIPPLYRRDRHGIFVGNAKSISITDTVATLRRTEIKDAKATEVEGIRIYGILGPFMVIRQNNLSGFPIGIRVVPENQPMAARIWMVAELLATGSKKTLDAPAQVQRDRLSP